MLQILVGDYCGIYIHVHISNGHIEKNTNQSKPFGQPLAINIHRKYYCIVLFILCSNTNLNRDKIIVEIYFLYNFDNLKIQFYLTNGRPWKAVLAHICTYTNEHLQAGSKRVREYNVPLFFYLDYSSDPELFNEIQEARERSLEYCQASVFAV